MAASGSEKDVAKDAKEALEAQVAQLKREVARINRSLAERAEEMAESAGSLYDTAADKASRASQALRAQAQSVSETVKENPGTVSSAMVLGGLVGLLLGLAIGRSSDSGGYHRWR